MAHNHGNRSLNKIEDLEKKEDDDHAVWLLAWCSSHESEAVLKRDRGPLMQVLSRPDFLKLAKSAGGMRQGMMGIDDLLHRQR